MSASLETSDDQFLTEDINKDDDILDDLDNAAEEELLHFSEDDADFLDVTRAEEEVEYIDEDGNPVELGDGEQIEVLVSNETKEDENISPEESFEGNSAFLDSADNSAENVLDEEDDDDEEDEEEVEEEARRNRFRTERRNIVTINSSKRNNRDIPDSLDSVVLEEEAAKAAEFMNREKEKRRGGWRGNRRGFGGSSQRMISRKQPPLLSVMPQPQNKPKSDHQQLGIVPGATRLPPPKNFTQADSFATTPASLRIPQTTPQQSAPQTFEEQPINVESGIASPRKILINPHFRGNRTQAPTATSRAVAPQHPESSQYEGETLPKMPSFNENHHYDPSHYSNQYEQDPHYGHYEQQPSPSIHNYPPPETVPHQGPPPQPAYHPHVEHQHHPNYQEFAHHPPPPTHLQRPPHQLHQPPYRHPHQEPWNGGPPSHHPHPPPPPRMPHHPGGAPPPQHMAPPPPHHYEPRYRGPPPPPNHMEHHQHHHPPHLPPHMQRFQDPHHFHPSPPPHLQQPYPPPPHHQQHFRPPPPNIPNHQEYRPPPPHHYGPVNVNEEYQHPYEHSYQTEHHNQFAENEPDLYKSFDNNEWNDPNYNVVPQSLSVPGRGFHHQTSRGLKHGFVQRRPVNKRPVNEPSNFAITTSPKQMRLENRAMSKNIKEVPITENLPPVPLPPGKEILPPEDEDEETKELRRKLEEQKKQREENLRKKEERRRLMATERLKQLNASQQAQNANLTNPNPQPKPISKPLVKPTPNLATPKLIQGANLVNPNLAKKKVIVVRKAQGNTLNPQMSGNASSQKMVLVRGASRGNAIANRGRGIPVANQFGQRINQFGQRINPNITGAPTFSNPRGTVNPRGVRGGGHLPRRGMATVRATAGRILHPNPVRQVNAPQRIIQPGTPSPLKMVRKMAPVKVPANRQVIAADSQENLSLIRRVDLQGEASNVVQSQNTRVVRPPQNTQEKCVLINNLSATTTENQLRQLTQPIGAVETIKLMKDGKAATKAIIQFKQQQHAFSFQQKYQRHMLDLSMIQVSMISPQLSQIA